MPANVSQSKLISYEELLVYNFRAYISPSIAIIGIPANIMCFVIFVILNKQSSCRFNLYCIGIAIVYNIQLITNTLIDDFLGKGLKWATNNKVTYQLDTQSSFLCKLITYLTDTSALIAAFILMIFSVDRVCSIYRAESFYQKKHTILAHTSILLCYLICGVLEIPDLYFANLEADDMNEYSCQYVNPTSQGVQYLLYLYIIGVAVLPSLFIFTTNLLILFKLSHAIYLSKITGIKDEQSSSEVSKVLVHLTISILFFLITLPLVVCIILRQQVDFLQYKDTYPEYSKRIVQYTKLFSSVDSFNHAFDFFIYYAFMPTFRRCFLNLFKLKIDWQSYSIK